MNKLIIYILLAVFGIGGTWANTYFRERKIVKAFTKRIEALQKDSTNLAKQSVILSTENRSLFQSDSLKSELINEKELILSDLNKIRNVLAKENKALTAWKLDAQDGIITDTVRVKRKLFGGYKIVK